MPSTHRFQSHLFQTVQSKLSHLQDTLQIGWRRLKVAAAWNAQLTLYPLQAVFRMGQWSRQILTQQMKRSGQDESAALGSGTAETDQPIQNVLNALYLHPIASSALEPKNKLDPKAANQWQISIKPPDAISAPKSTLIHLIQKGRKLWQRLRGTAPQDELALPTTALNIASNIALNTVLECSQTTQSLIQGVASALATRRLVLIDKTNQVLDILSAEQQLLLHQRILFEISAVQQKHQFFKVTVPKLPTVSALVPTQRWLQVQRPLGFLVDSFRPLVLPLRPLFRPFLALFLPASQILPEPSALTQSTGLEKLIEPAQRQQWAQPIVGQLQRFRAFIMTAVSTAAIAPFTLLLPAKAAATPAVPLPTPSGSGSSKEWLIDPARTRRQWLRGFNLFRSSKPIQGKVRLASEKASAPSHSFQSALAAWAYRYAQAVPSAGSPPIDVNAAFMGYHYHPLEKLLIFLDQMMAWLEAQIFRLWERVATVIRRVLSKTFG